MTTFESRLGKRQIVLACLALAGLAGLARPVAAQSGVVEAIGPRLGKEYRLLQMVVAGQELPLPEESPITLKLLSDTVLGGKSTVNLYFTGFDLDDQGHIYWRKPGFATTLMAGPPEQMHLEQTFFAAMASTNALSFAGAIWFLQTQIPPRGLPSGKRTSTRRSRRCTERRCCCSA
jgi:heat shock protein HslJ